MPKKAWDIVVVSSYPAGRYRNARSTGEKSEKKRNNNNNEKKIIITRVSVSTRDERP